MHTTLGEATDCEDLDIGECWERKQRYSNTGRNHDEWKFLTCSHQPYGL